MENNENVNYYKDVTFILFLFCLIIQHLNTIAIFIIPSSFNYHKKNFKWYFNILWD